MAKVFGVEISFEIITEIPKKQKIAILLGAIVLIIIFYLWWWYFPVNAEITSLENQEAELGKKLSALEAIKKEIDKFKVEIDTLTAQYKKQSEILPQEEELPKLLISIADTGKETGVEIKSFTPGTLKKLEYYNEMDVNLKLSGNFHGIAAFIDRIRRFVRIVNVQDITLTDPIFSENKLIVKSECNLKIFSRP